MLLTKMCLKVDEWRDYIASVWEENSKKISQRMKCCKIQNKNNNKKRPHWKHDLQRKNKAWEKLFLLIANWGMATYTKIISLFFFFLCLERDLFSFFLINIWDYIKEIVSLTKNSPSYSNQSPTLVIQTITWMQ